MKETNYDVFLRLVNTVFRGCIFSYNDIERELSPSIISTQNLIKDYEPPTTPFEMFLDNFSNSFKENVRSELYRSERGWIDRGIQENRIKTYQENNQTYIVPILSSSAVGIDTSGYNDEYFLMFCFFDNFKAGINYLEQHLVIPKAISPSEFKWNKLDDNYRQLIIQNYGKIIKMSCKGLLLIRTNQMRVIRKINTNIFSNLIEGCFSGYETHPIQNKPFRDDLKRNFFNLCNDTPVHCDQDFSPLRSERIVRFLVRILSKRDNEIQPFVPLYAPLKSEESEPIQLADILVGASTNLFNSGFNPPSPLQKIFFDARKIYKAYRKQGAYVRSYYWFKE